MQSGNGQDVLRATLDPPMPSVGQQTCVTITTGMPSSDLDVTITIGGRIAFNGPAPPTKEVCVEPEPGEEGEDILVLVIQNNSSSSAAAFAGAQGEVAE